MGLIRKKEQDLCLHSRKVPKKGKKQEAHKKGSHPFGTIFVKKKKKERGELGEGPVLV